MSDHPGWFEELLSYVELDDDDRAALREAAAIVTPHTKEVAGEFYDRIQAFAGAAAVLRDGAQVRRLHATLERWVQSTLEGPWDRSYFASRARIGHVHARIGLEQRFMFGAMSVLRQRMHRLIAAHHATEPGRAQRVSLAVDKILDVELAIMLDTFRDALLTRVRRLEELERRGVEEQLARSEARYRDVIESAEVMVVVLDEEGRAIMWNRKAEELTGWARDEMLGRNPLPLFVASIPVRRDLTSATPARPRTQETSIVTRSGQSRTLRLVSTASRDPVTGGIQRYLMGVDLTHLREAEKRAIASEKLAAVGTLAAGLAHEIRNPVNAASLHVTVLERAIKKLPEPPASALEATRVLRVELSRLSGLVTDFLDFGRPNPLVLAACDVCEVAAHAVALLQPQADAAGVALSLEHGTAPQVARIDAGRLEQVFLNLLRNAIEATQGRSPATVTAHVRGSASACVVEITDDGPGIPATSPVFDAFFTTKEQGTGLGLAIAHRIVDGHGGALSVESRPGFTQFVISLPR